MEEPTAFVFTFYYAGRGSRFLLNVVPKQKYMVNKCHDQHTNVVSTPNNLYICYAQDYTDRTIYTTKKHTKEKGHCNVHSTVHTSNSWIVFVESPYQILVI